MVSFIKKRLKITNNQMILIFTDADLFPRDGWSFGKNLKFLILIVFGMTEVKSRVCLISTARHDPSFPSNNNESTKMNDEEKLQIMLYRALKVML